MLKTLWLKLHAESRSAITVVATLAVLATLYFLPSAYQKSQLDAEVDRLCGLDGGAKVYEHADLPASMFNKWGTPDIPLESDIKRSSNSEYFLRNMTKSTSTKGRFGTREAVMHRFHWQVIRRTDGKVLGEAVSYSRSGGDPEGPWHPSSYRGICTEAASNIERQVFQKG